MKKILKYMMIALLPLAAACDSFLDRQPDKALRTEDLFKTRDNTVKVLYNVYGWMSDETNPAGQTFPWTGAADESTVAYRSRNYVNIIKGTWQPNDNLASEHAYINNYKGIREANFFMQNCYAVLEHDQSAIPSEVERWYWEARYMRAYFYHTLMKVYGPVFLVGDEPIDFTDTSLRDRDRNTWEECMDYIVSELDSCAMYLPTTITNMSLEFGRATAGAAMALKSRMLLYNARPLFNGNTLFGSVIRPDGVNLFTTSYDASKWKLAADAAKDVIESGRYSLVTGSDPQDALFDLFMTPGNSEQIITQIHGGSPWRGVCTPPGAGGSAVGGIGPTQKLVDAFPMANGRYPITGYNSDTSPVIDANSGYSESGFQSFTHPITGQTTNTYNMYIGRDPRFYRSVFWSGSTWVGGANVVQDIQFYSGGNSGYITSHNYTPSGYTAYKFINQNLDHRSDWGWNYWPIMRYAEVLLNYVEALNEYDPGNPDILKYLNEIRNRVGLPDLEVSYSEIAPTLTSAQGQDRMRDFILKERMVELCYENHRYFDTRTWMISEQEDLGYVYGMNILATDHDPDGEFWQRTIIPDEGGTVGYRRFQPRYYLFPIPQAELDRVNVTQNYGW